MILPLAKFRKYIDKFNEDDEETVIQEISNKDSWSWLQQNIPFFECPDQEIEEVYYFRWWTYRKHIKRTPDGFIITEFHPNVHWAGKHNSINCSAGHHFYEGRWLKESKAIFYDFATFWFRRGGSSRSYSTWLVDGIWNYCTVLGKYDLLIDLLADFVGNFRAWESSNLHSSGLFWSNDDRDAMEYSISGSGLRPTLNSYLFADAVAIAKTAELAGDSRLQEEFSHKSSEIKHLMLERLWDPMEEFFKVLPLGSHTAALTSWDFSNVDPSHNVREEIGFIPWYFNIPDIGYENAWTQLIDPNGFFAPFGPTTAERRHSRFMSEHSNHECLWNGPSWPFSTSQTLTAMANLLNNYDQKVVSLQDYLKELQVYARSHYRQVSSSKRICWIDENLHPFTGEWLARGILERWGWRTEKGGYERGKDYNHSTYCDLIISGLIGLRAADNDELLVINPLIPQGTWHYFCLDRVSYRGLDLTIMYDETGQRYGHGAGLFVFVNGKQRAYSPSIGKIEINLTKSAY